MGISFIIRIAAQKQIGASPALKSETRLVTTGIYWFVRHPLYTSNGLFAIGMALLFNSLYSFLFSIMYTFLYLPIINLEERDLLKKYGDKYERYKEKVGLLFPNPKGKDGDDDGSGGHNHFDRSSRNLLDPEKVLGEMGLKKGDNFLDAGCGEGHFSIAASEMVGDHGKVYAIDISEDAINILKGEIDERGIETFTGDMTEELPMENESIDVCLMANILHGLVVSRKVEGTLKEIFRVLKPDGVLAVVDFKKVEGPPGPPIYFRMAPEEVEKIINKYGFKKKRIVEIGEYHYEITFIKDK